MAEAEGDVVGMGGGESRRGGQADGAITGAWGVSAGCKQGGGMNPVSILGRLSWPQGRMDWELGSGREGKSSQENLCNLLGKSLCTENRMNGRTQKDREWDWPGASSQ